MNDVEYLKAAYNVAKKSPDLSTQTGAIIVDPDNGKILIRSFNQFVRGQRATRKRLLDRPLKYLLTIHAETEAVCDAARKGLGTEGKIMYCTWQPCYNCAVAIYQSGIKELVIHRLTEHDRPDWQESFNTTEALFNQVGFRYRYVTDRIGGINIRFGGKIIQP